MLISRYHQKKLPKGFQGYPRQESDFWIFLNSSEEWKYSTKVVQKSTVTLDFLDFGNFEWKILFIHASTPKEFKDFWIVLKTFLSFPDLRTKRSRIFSFFHFLQYWHFHTIGIQGFLDLKKNFLSSIDHHIW